MEVSKVMGQFKGMQGGVVLVNCGQLNFLSFIGVTAKCIGDVPFLILRCRVMVLK